MQKERIPESLNQDVYNLRPLEAGKDGFVLGNESNVWYFKDASGAEKVIKKYPSWVKVEDITWIHNYMDYLARQNYPLVNSFGESVTDGSNYFAVYEYAKGSRFDRQNIVHASDMAVKLRLLHDLGRQTSIPGRRNWPTVFGYRADTEVLEQIDFEQDDNLLKTSWTTSQALLGAHELKVIPIHGDFRGDNMRFGPKGILKVFDFGNSRNDYAETDVAIALRDLSKDVNNSEVLGFQERFVEKYNSSGLGMIKFSAEGFCHAELILSIQECIYLWLQAKKTNDVSSMTNFKSEYDYLRVLLCLIPKQLWVLEK